MTASPRTAVPARRRLWVRILAWGAIIILIAQALGNFGFLSPLISPFVYQRLAPTGWRNISPHGDVEISGWAASIDTPGLMMACGRFHNPNITHLPESWQMDTMFFWLSRNGGANWTLKHVPFTGQQCYIAMPQGAPGLVLVQVFPTDGFSKAVSTWVSRDMGGSWREVAQNQEANWIQSDFSTRFVVRNGLLYATDRGSATLSVSADDGATWKVIAATPSALMEDEWALASISSGPTPDYQNATWWYRALSRNGQAPQLERSTDGGQHWAPVGGKSASIGSTPFENTLLATTAQKPNTICAAQGTDLFDPTLKMTILSSVDGGKTWTQGLMPASLKNAEGSPDSQLLVGDDGSCYLGYFYVPVNDTNGDRFVYLRLAPGQSTLQVISMGNQEPTKFSTYVPAENGRAARLVTLALQFPQMSKMEPLAWLAQENAQLPLIWTPAP